MRVKRGRKGEETRLYEQKKAQKRTTKISRVLKEARVRRGVSNLYVEGGASRDGRVKMSDD
mgnify:CR=1 FL=1